MTDTPTTPQPDIPPGEIEVGAAAGTLRYWLAKEALRHGELALAEQIEAANRARTRATALLGWSVTITTGLAVAASQSVWRTAALFGAAGFILCGISCVAALWPRPMIARGGQMAWLLSQPYETELEVTESLAQGTLEAYAENSRELERIMRFLKAGWLLFIAAPIAGAIAISL